MKVFVKFPKPSAQDLQQIQEKIKYGRHWFFKGLILKGPISRKEKDELLLREVSSSCKEAVEELYQKALYKEYRDISRQLEKLEKKITKYGEIFIEFPDVWCERRLIEYGKTRNQDLSDIRDLCKEGVQATFKEAHLTGIGLGKVAEPAAPQAPARPAEGLTLPLQDQFRLKSTFLAEAELQKLVEGRDDNTLLRGYAMYLLRFLVTVLPGIKRRWYWGPTNWWPPNWKFDSRNIYAEATMRIDPPELEDIEEKERGLIEILKRMGLGTKEERKEWLEGIKERRKPYVYNFIPQEYVQHIGAWSAISRKYGLDIFYPSPETQAQPSSPTEEKQEREKGGEEEEKVFEGKALGKQIPLEEFAGFLKTLSTGEGKGKTTTALLEKAASVLKTLSGMPEIPTIPVSVRKQYNAESEAILSHQTLISFMRDDSEVGWLFGPRLVGPNKRVPEKGVKQVYILLVAPGELPVVRLNMTTNWANIDDLRKKAYAFSEACELLKEYKCIRDRIDFLDEKKDAVVQALLAQAERVYCRIPVGSSLLFLPYDRNKKERADECGIGDLKPVITSISPNSGPCNVETTVLIKGRNFDYYAQVKIDGEDIPSVTLINRETLLATIPPSKLGMRSAILRVLTPIDISDITDHTTFQYTAPVHNPQITNVKPAEKTQPGQPITVTISGDNFDHNTKVLVDEREVSVSFINEKKLMVRFPKDVKGRKVSVKVYNPKGVDLYSFSCPRESLSRR